MAELEKKRKAEGAGDDDEEKRRQSLQMSVDMSLILGSRSDGLANSVLDLQEISGEQIEDDFGIAPGASKILASVRRAEPETKERFAPRIKIDPTLPI